MLLGGGGRGGVAGVSVGAVGIPNVPIKLVNSKKIKLLIFCDLDVAYFNSFRLFWI